MIVTKTPLRISFFGGGSDIPEFYEQNDGMVLSTAIDRYIYIATNKCAIPHCRVIYSELEEQPTYETIKHDRVRETLRHLEISTNVEIASFSEISTRGSGLGSSSTFTVGLINALYKMKTGKSLDHHELAEQASFIEIHRCFEPIGKQDQYAAAYGGFNAIYFNGNQVRVRPVDMDHSFLIALDSNLLCFNTGINRAASSVLTEQVASLKTGSNVEATKAVVELAKNGLKLLQKNKIDDFGHLLDQGWQIKKTLSSGITTPEIDEMYEHAIKNGALGGKLLGAGGGGYLLVYVPDKSKNRLLTAMSKYERFPFKFAKHGSTLELT